MTTVSLKDEGTAIVPVTIVVVLTLIKMENVLKNAPIVLHVKETGVVTPVLVRML